MLMLIRRGDDLLVCGSNGGNHATPNWYGNLMAARSATATVGPDTWTVRARQLDGRDREECWALLCDAYPDFATYQALTERQLPIAVLERVTGEPEPIAGPTGDTSTESGSLLPMSPTMEDRA
jgi:deazaflavin-dependent oxidoreductase (nitroreductase family)